MKCLKDFRLILLKTCRLVRFCRLVDLWLETQAGIEASFIPFYLPGFSIARCRYTSHQLVKGSECVVHAG